MALARLYSIFALYNLLPTKYVFADGSPRTTLNRGRGFRPLSRSAMCRNGHICIARRRVTVEFEPLAAAKIYPGVLHAPERFAGEWQANVRICQADLMPRPYGHPVTIPMVKPTARTDHIVDERQRVRSASCRHRRDPISSTRAPAHVVDDVDSFTARTGFPIDGHFPALTLVDMPVRRARCAPDRARFMLVGGSCTSVFSTRPGSVRR